MHAGILVVEDTGCKTTAVLAGGNDGADTRNSDLAAVGVACQHQLALLLSGPFP